MIEKKIKFTLNLNLNAILKVIVKFKNTLK